MRLTLHPQIEAELCSFAEDYCDIATSALRAAALTTLEARVLACDRRAVGLAVVRLLGRERPASLALNGADEAIVAAIRRAWGLEGEGEGEFIGSWQRSS